MRPSSFDPAVQAHARGEAHDLGEAFHEMGYLLPGECWLAPDVSVTYARQTEGKYFEGAPAIAIEVISPSNTAKRIDAKAELYFRFGASEVWRFFPKKRQVMIQVSGSVRVIAGDSAITTPLLPGIALSPKELFGD